MLRFFSSLIDPFSSDTAVPPSRVWPYLVAALKPFTGIMLASLALTIFGALLEVWLIGYAGSLVDILSATSPADLWATKGAELLLVGAIVLLVRPLGVFLREGLDDIAFRTNASFLITWRAHRHVLRQPVGWFRNDLAGRIANWVQVVGGSATSTAYSLLHTVAYVGVYVLGSLGLVASIDPALVIPLLVWMGLYGLMMRALVPRITKAVEVYQERYSTLAGLVVDSYSNIDTIKLFARDSDDQEDRAVFGAAREGLLGYQKLEVLMNSGMLFLGSVLLVGLIGYAIVLWQAGAAPVGLIAIAVTLSFRITAMAEWMLDAVSNFFSSFGALRQGLKTVAQPLLLTDAPDAKPLQVTAGAISFTDVVHHYGKDDGGLAGLTLAIAPGEKVGLVGRSGAGKSTLVNLVLRFFDAEAGRIEIDGQDITRVTQESLRASISMVTQDAALLHRSVRDNIAFGRSDVPQAAIEAAAAKAQADRFIPGLRDHTGRTGYDAHAGERGVILSGGQRQRIALARAILKNAKILILDEATSALDSEVEAAIQDTLEQVMEGKTVIAIAHRLSTIARMDRIVVLDEGRVAEQGAHETLLQQGGIYAQLWARQAGGFIQ